MARLNEPPVAPAPSQDAFDAVKRKFMRTNRELAKINSQQQIYIRTLENERSRLVAENCSLAQQVLHLQNTLETQAHAPSFSTIDTVKNQLEAKIQELGGLVTELGQLNKRRPADTCTIPTAKRRSPEERQWKSALGLQEVENAMLPTIMETKSYPRITMNAEELQDILDAPDSQSPDIGPPPVSRFDIDEPITFDPSPADEDLLDATAEDDEPALPANLETRRKRRESGPKSSDRRKSLFEPPPDDTEEEEAEVKFAKTGSKRKFSVQEDEDKGQSQAVSFQFSRRHNPTEDISVDEENRPLSRNRTILSSKPVNTDPVISPKKQRPSAPEKFDKPEKPGKRKSSRSHLVVTHDAQLLGPVPNLPKPIPTAEIHLDTLPPKTPAAEVILSPPSTAPSVSRNETEDTPPPGDLASMSQTGIVGRPSRRTRPQVSYKEPSLNTKMRRPSKELVDAVMADHSRRTSVERPTSAPPSAHAMIKEEPGDSPWKPVGAVGGMRESDAAELGSPLRQKLDRKEGSQDAKTERQKLNSAAAAQAISAMIEETSTAKRKSLSMLPVKETTDEPRSMQNKESKPRTQAPESEGDMAIFDFTESSPSTGAPSAPNSRPKISLASAVRAGRRHSSVPTSVATEDGKTELAPSKSGGALPSVHKRTGSGAMKTAPAAGLAKSTAAARSSLKERERRAGGLPSSRSASDLKGRAGAEERSGESRSERTGSRRRSMLV